MRNKRWIVIGVAAVGLASTATLLVPGFRSEIRTALRHHWPKSSRLALGGSSEKAAPGPSEGEGRSPWGAAPDGTRIKAFERQASGAAPGAMSIGEPNQPIEAAAPPGPSIAVTDPEAPKIKQAIAFYRRGDLAGGDAVAATIGNPIARLTADWAALRLLSHEAGLARMDAFIEAHEDWPAGAWLKRRVEEAVGSARSDPALVETRLGSVPLRTVAGKTAFARVERARGRTAAAAEIVRQVWREDDMSGFQESLVLREFGDLLTRDDHMYRAERLLYKEQTAAGLKEAALAGPDVVLLAKARAAVIAGAASDAAIAAVPKALQDDPGLTFSRIQKARRSDKIDEAAALMLNAPHDPAKIINGDEWWVERRLVARKLLDQGDAKRAYLICAGHSASSSPMKIEAEFHAGWIALRFLDDPTLAMKHFTLAAAAAETPMSKARAAYWQGRAAEASGAKGDANAFFTAAAQYSISFYGQLAAERIGRTEISLRSPPPIPTGDARSEAVRVAEYLFALGERDIALPLALEIARNEPSEAQVAAVALVVAQSRDAGATLAVGKAATQRGMALDESAFPTFGIPSFQPLRNSADLAVVYAIARQESEFDQKAVSSAGAVGLMQMISSTARRTAERAGVDFDQTRLMNDPAFNAQLGAAHLGALLAEQRGSYILTFAAYNAGGKNVKDWVDAYGDPRKPDVDPVDWIERIPFTETRNYVQRVLENLRIYGVRLGRPATLIVGNDARPVGRGT